jgi:hypothetical protein
MFKPCFLVPPARISGMSVENLPETIATSVNDLVDSALADLDQGELVTIPSLPDYAGWSTLECALRSAQTFHTLFQRPVTTWIDSRGADSRPLFYTLSSTILTIRKLAFFNCLLLPRREMIHGEDFNSRLQSIDDAGTTSAGGFSARWDGKLGEGSLG